MEETCGQRHREGVMDLEQLYEKETGKPARLIMCHVVGATEGYIEWLEARASQQGEGKGCEGCKHELKGANCSPCESCRRNTYLVADHYVPTPSGKDSKEGE